MTGPQLSFSSRRALTLGFATVAVLLAGTAGWGSMASISGAVIASGRVEVESRDRVVEHIDGGTVGEIRVGNGSVVEAGDVLVRFDDSDLRSEEALLDAQLIELVARRNRLEAEFRSEETIRWDDGLAERAGQEKAVRTVMDGQTRLFLARRASRSGQVSQLRERIDQTVRQAASLEAQAEAVERQRRFFARELEAQRKLFDKGFVELHRMMAIEREAAVKDGEAGDIAARIAAARSRIAEIEIQILQIGSKRIEDAEAEARQVQAEEIQVRERLALVRSRLGRMEVRAPVAGEVFDLRVFASQEVVRPGEAILHIVPRDAALIVRARLDTVHVDQVWPGQEAAILFPAFSTRTTPTFEGRVLRVSADATHDDRTGLSWYEIEVAPGRAIEPGSQTAEAQDLALAPGMPAEVQIRTGERSPLSYFVKPLTDYFARSLREE